MPNIYRFYQDVVKIKHRRPLSEEAAQCHPA